MKKTPHLDFYKRCLDLGTIPLQGGLCNAATEKLIKNKLLKLFHPTQQDFEQLVADGYINEGLAGPSHCYWAYGGSVDDGHDDRSSKFTTLRQTIILFMAAINNEL